MYDDYDDYYASVDANERKVERRWRWALAILITAIVTAIVWQLFFIYGGK